MQLVFYSKHDYSFLISTKGFNTAENRNYIAAQAIKNGSDYLLLTDDDMIFEPEVLDRLLAHNKDIVGAIYNTRRGEISSPIIEYFDEKRPTELFKCGALGGGLLLIKTKVFLKIKQPWFGYEWYDNGMVKMSNDWWFCYEARRAGYDIWADSRLEVKHIGDYEY